MTEGHQYRRVVCANCGYAIDVPIYCGDRFCPICSRPRLKRVRLRLESLIKQVPFISGNDLKHLTLTIRNQQNLPKMVAYLVKSFKTLRRTQFWQMHVYGGAFVIEVTGGKGSWHAHLHIIIQCKWIRYEHLLSIWQHITNGRGVYITRIPKTQVVKYLTKYLTKPAVSSDSEETAGRCLASYRLFQTFGKWHSIKVVLIKELYHCPECKACSWIPFDILHADLLSRNALKAPP